MSLSRLTKKFFRIIDARFGPFDRPIQFRVFPFDAGGALNFLIRGAGRKQFVTYVSWDLFAHPEQKRGRLGRYEILVVCDDKQWCLDVLTKIGRQSLQEVFEPGNTLHIGPWVGAAAPLQGVIFEEPFRTQLRDLLRHESCGLLRCIGVTRLELVFAMEHGTPALVERLKRAGISPPQLPAENQLICQEKRIETGAEHG